MLTRRDFFRIPTSQPPPREGYWLHVHRSAMACRFEVTLSMAERSGVPIAQSALDEIERIEQQLTVFREGSEVSFINRNAALRPVPVEISLFELLVLSRELHRDTDGAFDVTSGPLSRCWGFLRRQGRVPEVEELEHAKSQVGTEKIILNRELQTIHFNRSGLEINFGSIGKGYALDRISALFERRVRSALLSAGSSSFRAMGQGDSGHDGWVVGVRDPRRRDRRLAIVKLRDCAMSTSGNEEQFFEHNGTRYGHIIDPRTGQPADLVSAATVIADSAAVTDALATAFYVGGPILAQRYCSEHPGTLALILERGAKHPVIYGSNPKCEVEVLDE